MNNFEKLKQLDINHVADILAGFVILNDNDCTKCLAFKYCNTDIQDCSEAFKNFLNGEGDILTEAEFKTLAHTPNIHGQKASECCSFDWNVGNINCTCYEEKTKCKILNGEACLLHSGFKGEL